MLDRAGRESISRAERGQHSRASGTPSQYSSLLTGYTIIGMFEKPSLRTRVSLDVAATSLGGHFTYYDLSTSPMSSGKESPADTAKVLSRMVDAVFARLKSGVSLDAIEAELSGFASAFSTRNAAIKIGATTDTEFAATSNALATGDDTTGSDDEDGVSFTAMTAGAPASIAVTATNTTATTAACMLSGTAPSPKPCTWIT